MARLFSFISLGLPGDSFEVVRFQGQDQLSQPYHFQIDLISHNPRIDMDEVLQNPARLSLNTQEQPITFNGIVASFRQRHQAGDYTFYQAELVPRLWWLGQTIHNQVILLQTLPEFLTQILLDGGLAPQDFEFRLEHDYPRRDYVCQYRESHLNFLQRMLEQEGINYFFEQQDQREKIILTDSRLAHVPLPGQKPILYRTPSGLDAAYREQVIHEFSCHQNLVPQTVRLRNHNYEQPSLRLESEAQVCDEGRGEVYRYGDYFSTEAEGNRLARVRAEEIQCRQQTFHGQGTSPFLQPGYLFSLQDHYRNDFNQEYLITEIHHQGSQAQFMIAGLGAELSEGEKQPYYSNSFSAIPGSVQFRPPMNTEKPRFYGMLHGKVDASGSGLYAELDEQGRYKVILPFDLSGRKDGTASAWLRMMQPYTGAGHGMHFPLHKGTEVLISFIDGDPDRPVIAGAVPNPETQSVVTAENASMANITTGCGNRIHIEDKEGSERILLHSPKQKSFIRIGAHNDPVHEEIEDKDQMHDKEEETGEEPHWYEFGQGDIPESIQDEIWDTCNPDDKSIKFEAENTLAFEGGHVGKIIKGKDYTAIGGEEKKWVFGHSFFKIHGKDEKIFMGNKFDMVLGFQEGINVSNKAEAVVGLAEELNISAKIEFAMASKAEFNLLKLQFETEVTKIRELEEKLTAKRTELDGEIGTLTGERDDITGSIQTLQGTINRLTGQRNEMGGDTTAIDAVINSNTLLLTQLTEERNEMNGQVAELSGTRNKIVATETTVVGLKEVV